MDHSERSKKYKKALLIDDDNVELYITTRVIISSSFADEVVSKGSVDEAIAYLKSINEDSEEELPDIIFLDMKMPGKDGFNFLEEFISLDDKIKSNCKIVILMSSPPAGVKEKSRTTIDKVILSILEKPLTLEALRKMNEPGISNS